MSLQTDPTPSFAPSDPFGTPAGLSLSDTFIKALTQPNEQAYQQIASDAPANDNKAYRWIFIAGTIASLIGSLAQLVFPATRGINGQVINTSGGAVVSLVCAPVVGIIEVLGFAFGAAIIQAIARALGGTGTHTRFRYTYAASAAPMLVITAVAGAIPIVSLLNIFVGFYQFYLSILAVKTVNQFGWGKAFVATVVVPFVVICLIAGIIVVVLAMLGPSIGNIFSNITSSL